jgi:hypothetical protein
VAAFALSESIAISNIKCKLDIFLGSACKKSVIYYFSYVIGFFNVRDGVAYFFKIFHGKIFYIKIHPRLFQTPLNRFFYIEIENSNVF